MDIGRIMAIILSISLWRTLSLINFWGPAPPFLGVSKKNGDRGGYEYGRNFVMIIATLFTWLVYYYVLLPFNLLYMQIVTFILIIASLVQLVETMMKKVSPVLYQGLGGYFCP